MTTFRVRLNDLTDESSAEYDFIDESTGQVDTDIYLNGDELITGHSYTAEFAIVLPDSSLTPWSTAVNVSTP